MHVTLISYQLLLATEEAGGIEDKTVPPNNGKSHTQPMASIDDDASVASGMGTRALQFLLSHQSTKRSRTRNKLKRSRKAPPSEVKSECVNESLVGDDPSDSDEDISVAACTNALATLLAHICSQMSLIYHIKLIIPTPCRSKSLNT